MHTTAILDRLVAVNLDVRIWSGRKKLTAEDRAKPFSSAFVIQPEC